MSDNKRVSVWKKLLTKEFRKVTIKNRKKIDLHTTAKEYFSVFTFMCDKKKVVVNKKGSCEKLPVVCQSISSAMEKVKEKKSPDPQINKSSHIMNQSSEKLEKTSSGKIQNCLEFCSDKDNCLSLNDILRSFNAPLSEEQAWSLIYQSVLLYRNFIRIEFTDKHTKKEATQKSSHRIKVPKSTKNLNVHKDGSVHISDGGELNKADSRDSNFMHQKSIYF